MEKKHRGLALSRALLLGFIFSAGPTVFAAKPIDLSHQQVAMLQTFLSSPTANAIKLEEINRSLDFNKTLHVRIQQTYSGYPIFGADSVIHIPHGEKTAKGIASVLTAAKVNQGSMNGIFYQNLQTDLANISPTIFTQAHAKKALQQVIDIYQEKLGKHVEVKDQQTNLIIFIDENNQAHWAYKVSFLAPAIQYVPTKPVYIVDARTFQVYENWDDIKTAQSTLTEETFGGGYGGNIKMGRLVYDGLI